VDEKRAVYHAMGEKEDLERYPEFVSCYWLRLLFCYMSFHFFLVSFVRISHA
jgi:hypothetical protein